MDVFTIAPEVRRTEAELLRVPLADICQVCGALAKTMAARGSGACNGKHFNVLRKAGLL